MVMKIGVLTGGGDCSGLNAAIRAITKSLIHEFGAEVIGIEKGILGLLENKTKPLNLASVSGLIDKGGTLLKTCNNVSPFNYHGNDCSQLVVDNYKALQLDGIIVMGGDGTMSMCHELSQLGLNFVGVPKTIDNDLVNTDRTFGFETAVGVVVDAIDRLKTTSYSHNRIMIIETMGRYAGWIALHAGLAGAADVILLPEYPYELDTVISAIESRAAHESPSIIVIAEGAIAKGGDYIVSKTVENSPDAIRLGGVGHHLQQELEKHISLEVRTTVLGHIQRGGTTSAFDRIFSTNVGCYAASLVAQGRYGRMVTVQNGKLSSIPLESVANKTRTVQKDDMTLISALSLGICFGDKNLQASLTTINDEKMKSN
ncbi:6-phosphofructokinase [Paraglaciecola sp. L3A3]|uniref:6-phosphofructokinase n=1 Tax=Paraglaciecola sp. L3A3 TaxID=2686358 RepID=UPI0018EED659|nr:ATP-dependent 6-phosphofructokinase [Paraglaciecola sp. L3A3]